MTKKNLRQHHRLMRDQISKQTASQNSASIYTRLIQMSLYQSAQNIACYVSIKNEVDTQQIIQNALMQKKQVGVPITQSDGIMEFQTLTNTNELQKVHHGLLEPTTNPQKIISPRKFDLAIVPGIAFDRQGHRIGSGGGYYDRYLAQTNAIRIGLAYDFQLLENIPTEPHDLKMDWVITENESIQILL